MSRGWPWAAIALLVVGLTGSAAIAQEAAREPEGDEGSAAVPTTPDPLSPPAVEPDQASPPDPEPPPEAGSSQSAEPSDGLPDRAALPIARRDDGQPGRAADAATNGKRKGTPDRLAFGGRVYVRDTLTGIDAGGGTSWREERALDTARAFLVFRPSKRVRMDLEVDFAGDEAELKDTSIEYEPASFLEVKVGRFKRPVSFIGLESSWSLPRIERGLLSELRLDGQRLLFAGGRGDGVALTLDLPGSLRPELTLAVQLSELADDLGLEVTDAVNQDVFGRAQIEPVEGLHLAVAGGWTASLTRLGDADSYRHRPFGSLEGFFEAEAARLWLEVMAGANGSAYVGAEQIGRFAAAQALIAPRLKKVAGLRALEPYAAVAWYEPSTAQDDDQLAEATAGVALWVSRHLRLQLEGGRRFGQGARAPSADATLVRVQLGASFKSETVIK